MAIRRFQVSTPDQLLALQEYAKDGNLTRAASIWRTTREKKGGKGTSWDDKIYVDFCAYDGTRTAFVNRVTVIKSAPTPGKTDHSLNGPLPPRLFAHLRYNPALQWCKEHAEIQSETRKVADMAGCHEALPAREKGRVDCRVKKLGVNIEEDTMTDG